MIRLQLIQNEGGIDFRLLAGLLKIDLQIRFYTSQEVFLF